MAYANLVNQAVTDSEEAFQRIRDFICKRNGTYDYSTTGIGWTLHDSSYAVDEDNLTIGDWVVFKSIGEDGKADLYFYYEYFSTTYHRIRGWLYWNNSTHVGVQNVCTATSNMMCDNSSHDIWIYGDLDFISVIHQNNAGNTNYGCNFGFLGDASWYDTTVATSASAVSSGIGVTITLDTIPSSWAIGRNLVLRDNAGMEHITILTLSGNDITADVTNNYAAGCKMARDYPVVQSNLNNSWGASCLAVLFSHSSTFAISQGIPVMSGAAPGYDPDPYEDNWGALPILIGYSTTGHFGSFPNHLIGPITMTDYGVYTTDDGVSYRHIECYSGAYFLFKEV